MGWLKCPTTIVLLSIFSLMCVNIHFIDSSAAMLDASITTIFISSCWILCIAFFVFYYSFCFKINFVCVSISILVLFSLPFSLNIFFLPLIFQLVLVFRSEDEYFAGSIYMHLIFFFTNSVTICLYFFSDF